MKNCTKCGIKKPLSEFHNCSSKKDRKTSACKVCRNEQIRAISSKLDQSALYKKRMEEKGEAERERRRAYYQANKERIKAKSNQWRLNNPDRKKESQARHYLENKEKYILRSKEWGAANREKRTQICIAYMERKRNENPREYVATVAARKMLARILGCTGRKKRGRTFDVLGYNRQQFEQHIESQFQAGMTWANHGEWHIDHIIPVSELIRCGVTDPAKINALANLRPLWATDNMSKSALFELAPPEAWEITRAAPCPPKKSRIAAQTC